LPDCFGWTVQHHAGTGGESEVLVLFWPHGQCLPSLPVEHDVSCGVLGALSRLSSFLVCGELWTFWCFFHERVLDFLKNFSLLRWLYGASLLFFRLLIW
jgi:hypothetical protein